jgi:SRSO17 transposase
MSISVARRHCGRLGKTDNCQASVMLGSARPEGYGLVDYELYMPKPWHEKDHAEKRKKCHVPEDLEFKTKNRILLETIDVPEPAPFVDAAVNPDD